MTHALYRDPVFEKTLRTQIDEKRCNVCQHAQRDRCGKGYSGFYQCRDEIDGFKLDEGK